ncbi:MAG: hypothetical protein ACK56F_22215, partial [bacterium]
MSRWRRRAFRLPGFKYSRNGNLETRSRTIDHLPQDSLAGIRECRRGASNYRALHPPAQSDPGGGRARAGAHARVICRDAPHQNQKKSTTRAGGEEYGY